MTIGWTPNLLNAKYVSGDFDPQHCKRPPAGDRGYAPYPVRLGRADDDPDEAWGGHDDASILGLVMQEAIGELYQRKIVDGYHNKLEGSYRLNPGGASRTHLHCHCVGNGRETNGQFIAETLLECVHKALMKYRGRLHRKYYPDIQVKRNTSAEHLEKAIIYSEKVVPISRIVDDALSRPEAQLADGSWNPVYIEYLKSSLAQLIDDDIPNIFTGYRLDPNLPRLFRRKTAGNMTFTDRGTCIGVEPDWHAKLRRKNAKKLRDARAAKRKRQAECREAGVPVPQTKSPKRRPAPRHLRRSVGLPSRKPAAPKRLAQAVDGTRRQDSG